MVGFSRRFYYGKQDFWGFRRALCIVTFIHNLLALATPGPSNIMLVAKAYCVLSRKFINNSENSTTVRVNNPSYMF